MRGAALVAVALVAAGCTGGGAKPAWQEISLPTNASGRPVVRDVTTCAGHGYLAGGYRAGDGSTTPALWSTVDGRSWKAVPVAPKSAYGPQHLLSAVACRGDTVVAIGSAPGGVHGNLRTNTWIGGAGGPLTEVPAAFELFGGPQQIGVGQLVAGTPGWLIGGARTDANGAAGAAVWFATDGAAFRLVDNDPALESDTHAETVLAGVTAAPAGGFVAVGSAIPAGSPATRQPLAWRSPDGVHWTREVVPADGGDADIEAVTPYRDGLLALGIRGSGFGAWLGSPTGWRAVARFGTLGGSTLPQVTGLATRSGDAWAVGSDGTRYRLWHCTDAATWTELSMPAPVPAGGGALARLASLGGQLVLATESHVWITQG
jgi:hypothetical protein